MCPAVLCVVFYVSSQRFIRVRHYNRCPHYAPPRVEVVSGLVRQDNLMSSSRFREDGLEDLGLPTGGGARVNTLVGALAVAKQTTRSLLIVTL